MRTATYEADGISITYKKPSYTDILRIMSKLDLEKIGGLQDGNNDAESLSTIADALDSINPLIQDIQYKKYETIEDAMEDMAIMPHMVEIFKTVLDSMNQSSKKATKRKK